MGDDTYNALVLGVDAVKKKILKIRDLILRFCFFESREEEAVAEAAAFFLKLLALAC